MRRALAQEAGALHSRTIEKRMAAAKSAKIKLLFIPPIIARGITRLPQGQLQGTQTVLATKSATRDCTRALVPAGLIPCGWLVQMTVVLRSL